MTQLEQIIKLSELGYSKDEITALMGAPAPAPAPAAPVPEPAPAQAPEQPNNATVDFLEALKLIGQSVAQPAVQAPAPSPEPTTVPESAKQPSINLTAEDLVKLTQGIAVQTAAGSIETPRSANDIILGMLDAYESTVKED